MKKRWSIFIAMMILCIAVCVPVLADAVPTLELVASKQIASPGNEFTVDIVIHNNPGIAVANFAISYDESVLQLTIATDQSLTGWDVGIKADPEKTEEVNREKAAWVMVDRSNWDENGCSILQLTFRVLDKPTMGNTEINLTELVIANIDEKKIPFTAAPATVTIQEEPPLRVTPSSSVLSDAYTVSGQVVTVTYDKPCKVGYLSGGKYVAVPAVASGSGYAFTLPDGVTEAILVVKGDVNGDGKINIADVNRLFRYTSKKEIILSDKQYFAADVNLDKKVNIADVNRLFRFTTKQITTL